MSSSSGTGGDGAAGVVAPRAVVAGISRIFVEAAVASGTLGADRADVIEPLVADALGHVGRGKAVSALRGVQDQRWSGQAYTEEEGAETTKALVSEYVDGWGEEKGISDGEIGLVKQAVQAHALRVAMQATINFLETGRRPV